LSQSSFCNAACALTVALVTHSAGAADPRLVVDLSYQADPVLRDCPREDEFKASIRRQVGYDPFQRGARHHVLAGFHADGAGIRGAVTWRDESGQVRGERDLYLDRNDCPAFARMLGFAIVVQLDLFNQDPEGTLGSEGGSTSPVPAAGATEASSSTGSPAETATTSMDSEVDAPLPDAPDAEHGRTTLALGVGPFAGVGYTSRPALGGRAFATIRRNILALELGFEASLPAQNTLTSPEGFQENLMLGSFSGCIWSGRLSGCLVGKAGALRVRGVGVDVSRSSVGPVAQLGPRFMVSQRLGGAWAAALRIDLLAALVPWQVTLDHQEVWSTPAVGVSVGADLFAFVRDNPDPHWTIPSSR
jgi:hypothetical protein